MAFTIERAAGSRRRMNQFLEALSGFVAAASGRAASALAAMSRQSVEVAISSVKTARAEEHHEGLCRRFEEGLSRVTVQFSGALHGTGILILGTRSANELARAVHSETEQSGLTEDDVLVEVGSVLLNACIGTYAGLVPGRVVFGVPQIQIARRSEAIADLLRFGSHGDSLWAETDFVMPRGSISGLIVVSAPMETLHALVAAIEQRSLRRP